MSETSWESLIIVQISNGGILNKGGGSADEGK